MNPPPNLPPYGVELWNAAQACIRPSHNGTKGEFRDLAAFKDLCSPSKIVALLRELAVSQELPGESPPVVVSKVDLDVELYLKLATPADRMEFLDGLSYDDPEHELRVRARLVERHASTYPPTYGGNTKVCDHCKLIHPRGERCPVVARAAEVSQLLEATLRPLSIPATINVTSPEA